MFTTNVFDYTNILDKAADASWMRENVITNNIANIDTPGYKRQDVDFESVLQKALGKTKYSSLDKKVRELNQDLGNLQRHLIQMRQIILIDLTAIMWMKTQKMRSWLLNH